jgi:hypothetical protein
MPITINGGSTTTYWQGWDSFRNPSASTTETTVTTGGTTTFNLVKDVTVATTTTPSATVVNQITSNSPIIGVTNLTPTICDASTFPNVNSLQNGLGKLNLTTTNGGVQIVIECSAGTSFSSAYLSAYTAGSLATTINTLVLNAVGARTAPAASFMNVYSSGFTRNTNLYTNSIIDLSPWTDNGYGNGCALISPRHIVFITHSSPTVGDTITFTRAIGGTISRQITVVARNINGLANSDIGIGYLSEPISASDITPYSVLPANATATLKLPLSSESTGAYGALNQGIYGFIVKKRFPFGGGDNIRQMQLGVITNTSGSLSTPDYAKGAGVSSQPTNVISQTSDMRYLYSRWFTTMFDGDSGSPTFLPTGLTTATGTPLTLLLGVQSYPTIASAISSYIPQINQAMNDIKTGGDGTVYALNEINVSQSAWWNAFTTY